MPLDLSSLRRAVSSLHRAVRAAEDGPATLGPELLETIRAGVIQNFEVAYEQSWKFIQRWLRENRIPEDADHPRTRKEFFRLAARHGLIADPLPWFQYGEARNLTSHTYDEAQALLVFESARRFAADAQALLSRLEAAND